MDPLKKLVPECLPEELQLDILYRLPVKALVRCMCVCKSWLSFIKSPTFVSTQLNRSVSSAKDRPLFLFRHCSWANGIPVGEHYCSLHFNDQSFKCYMKLPLPPRRPRTFLHEIIGSCNGLVCLADLADNQIENFFLWNPSLGKLMTLPRPEVRSKSNSFWYGYSISCGSEGFGFDSRTNDYKVVRAMRVATVLKVEVFSLNSGSWKRLSDFKPKYEIFGMGSPVCVKGRVHWLIYDNWIWNGQVLVFDLADEILWEVPVPECVNGILPKLSMVPYGDSSIALVRGINYFGHGSFKQSQIWVMKEHGETGSSWTNVGVMPFEHSGDAWRKLLRFNNSTEVMVMQNRGEVALADLISGEIKQLGLQDNTHSDCFLSDYLDSDVDIRQLEVGDSTHRFCLSHDRMERVHSFLGSYMESLALLDKQNNAEDETSDSDDEWWEISTGYEASDTDAESREIDGGDETSDSDEKWGNISAGDEKCDGDAEWRNISTGDETSESESDAEWGNNCAGDETGDGDAEWGSISTGDETSDSDEGSGEISGGDETRDSDVEWGNLSGGDKTSDSDAERGNIITGDETSDNDAEWGKWCNIHGVSEQFL